jgi:MEDS: MEthanogen/methylotroph, DcmR Sensory domain
MGREDWYYVHFPKLLIKRLDEFLQTPRAKSMGMSNKPELLRHVINGFLDEQEAFYNTTETVRDIILKTKDRDHLVLTYNDESQFEEIVNAFIKRGIDYNQINVLIVFRREEQKYLATLDKIPDINSLFNSQDLNIIQDDESFHNDGSFSVEPLVKSLHRLTELVKEKSKTGLNVLGTLAGQLIEQGRYDDAVKMDNEITEALQGLKTSTTIFCLYKSIPEDLEDRLSEYHDLVIKRAFKSTSTSSLH